MEYVMAVLTIVSVFAMTRWLLGGQDRQGDHVQELPDGTPFSEEAARERLEAARADATASSGEGGASAGSGGQGQAAAIAKPGHTVVLDDDAPADESEGQ